MPALLYFLALVVFAQGTSEFVLAGLLTDIAADLGITLTEAGLLTTAFALGMVLGAPAMAILARRFSARTALTSFLIVFVAAHIVGALTDSFPLLLLTRVVAAVANAGFLAVALALIVRIVEPHRQARAVGVVLAGTTLALIAGVPAGAVLGASFGWRAALWAIAVLCVPALLAGLTAPTGAGGGTGGAQRPPLRTELAVLRSRTVLGVIAVTVLVNAATFGAFTYLAVIAEAGLGLRPLAVPVLLALFGVGAFVGVTVAGRYADRHWARIVGLLGPCLVLVWASLTVVVAVAGLGARGGGDHLGVGIFWVLTPVAGALSFALGSTLIARIVSEARHAPNLGGAFATAALNLGAALGPVVAGLALSRLGEVGPFAVAAVCVGSAVGIWVLIRRAGLLAPG